MRIQSDANEFECPHCNAKFAADYDDQHAQQPVDWPTEPGWWWIDIDHPLHPVPRLCRYVDGQILLNDNRYITREGCERTTCRFLPAHIPTFPPCTSSIKREMTDGA